MASAQTPCGGRSTVYRYTRARRGALVWATGLPAPSKTSPTTSATGPRAQLRRSTSPSRLTPNACCPTVRRLEALALAPPPAFRIVCNSTGAAGSSCTATSTGWFVICHSSLRGRAKHPEARDASRASRRGNAVMASGRRWTIRRGKYEPLRRFRALEQQAARSCLWTLDGTAALSVWRVKNAPQLSHGTAAATYCA